MISQSSKSTMRNWNEYAVKLTILRNPVEISNLLDNDFAFSLISLISQNSSTLVLFTHSFKRYAKWKIDQNLDLRSD